MSHENLAKTVENLFIIEQTLERRIEEERRRLRKFEEELESVRLKRRVLERGPDFQSVEIRGEPASGDRK